MRGRRGFGRAVIAAQAVGLVVGHVLGQQPRIGLLDAFHRLPVTAIDAELHRQAVMAHGDVGVHAPRRIRAAAQHLGRMQRDLLVLGRARDPVLHAVAALRLHVEQAVAIGRAIGHGGVGDALRVLHSRPERTAGGTHVVLVQRPRAVPALRRVPEHLVLVVGVAAEHQRVRHLLQQREQARAVRGAERVVEQRNMQPQHHQPVLGHGRQVALEEGELVLAQAADVRRLLPRLGDDVVQADEHHRRLFPGMGIRAELAVEAVQRRGIAARAQVHVVVARHVQPRHPERRNRLDQQRVQRRIVVADVAQGHAQPR